MAGKLRLYHYIPVTRTEGPGLRACLWVQGCPRHCNGCAAPETWDFEAGYEQDVNELVEEILSVTGLDGITIAGGEPFCQAEALAELLGKLRERSPDFTIICFSGWTLEELKELDLAGIDRLLSNVDLLIDGPYIEALANNTMPLVGSSNQGFHFLTPRLLEWKNTWEHAKNKLEIRIMPDGRIVANGMLPGDLLNTIKNFKFNGQDFLVTK